MTGDSTTTLQPQEGPQKSFLKSVASVTGFGGAAAAGKSFALLLDMLYHVGNPKFRGLILRRTVPMLKQSGGLVDASCQIYNSLAAQLNQTSLTWTFPSGATVQLDGCEHEANRFDFQGSQYDVIAFDELSQFPESVFWYLQSRLRGTSGIRPSCKFTTNPDCDHFLRRQLAWWIDEKTGLPIPERAGLTRWFIRSKDQLVWADDPAELKREFGPHFEPKSYCFIPASVHDNKILLKASPDYVATLASLPRVDMERLLLGNWNAKAEAGDYFRRGDFSVVDTLPASRQTVRSWDRAATAPRPGADPDWTRGVKVSRDASGVFYVEHLASLRARPSEVERLIVNTASQDGVGVEILLQHDPGGAGTTEVEYAIRALAGFVVRAEKNTASKETRARGASTQSGAGNVKLLRGSWNEEFLTELENFPLGSHDDIVDALAAAVNRLAAGSNGAFSPQDVVSMRAANDSPSPGRTWSPRCWNVRGTDFRTAQEFFEARPK